MSIIKFEPNIPVTMAFTYDTGKSTEGTYGEQFFRKTTGGDSVYLVPFVEDKLSEMGYKKGSDVTITKRVSGKETRWLVTWPNESSERPLAGQPKPAPRANGTTQPMPLGTISSAMKLFLKEAVDLTKYAVEYANSQSFPMPADMLEVVQKIAVSLYIQYGKEGNMRRMHDYKEMEQAITDGARMNTEQAFRAGSQAAADAVALRKLAESRKEATEKESMPPPPAWSQEIDDSDVPF